MSTISEVVGENLWSSVTLLIMKIQGWNHPLVSSVGEEITAQLQLYDINQKALFAQQSGFTLLYHIPLNK